MRHPLWLAGLLAGGIAFPVYSQEIAAKDLFAQLDRNGDGKLEATEIPDGQFRFFERILRLGDRNSDGSLSLEELAFALKDHEESPAPSSETSSPKSVTKPEPAKKMISEPEAASQTKSAPTLGMFLQQFDSNQDENISREELPEGIRKQLEPIFERLDTDKIPLKYLEVMSLRKKESLPAGEGEDPVRVKGDWMGRDLHPGQGGEGPEGFRRPIPRLLRLLDKNQNGTLSKEEWAAAPQVFDELDLNQDGELGPFELLGPGEFGPGMRRREGRPGEGTSFPEMLFQRADVNGDGKVTPEEAPPRLRELFPRLDTNQDGSLTIEELRTGLPPLRRDQPGNKE